MSTTAIGRKAEDLAADAMRRAGFEILWRNLRMGSLELDIVARRAELVVIAEVRFRGPGAWAGPLASVTLPKRRALLKAARTLWRTRLRMIREIRRVRIDVIGITEDAVEWIEAAITGDDG